MEIHSARGWGNTPLREEDDEVYSIIEREKVRQWKGIELMASENFTSLVVLEAMGSALTNKYSEGLPGARYYGGNEYIDQVENLCRKRALQAFDLAPDAWGVNVQLYSGSSANFAVYTALLQPHERIMGLDLGSGGHATHGNYTSKKKVAAASIFFESISYKVNFSTGLIDFEKLKEKAMEYKPKILICGGSSYPREWDYAEFREIADKCGAILMCDMAHISGLIAAKEAANPFEWCDIVTTTTHKSLRGPRSGMIFYRKGPKPKKGTQDDGNYDYEDKINFAVFPSLQGGPHNHQIAALAVALKQAASPAFKEYAKQIRKNARALCEALIKKGYKLVTEGTDNHLVLWDLRPLGLTGEQVERVLESCHITSNRVSVFGETDNTPIGCIRVGTPAMTSRGFKETDFEKVADFLERAVNITLAVQKEHGKLLRDFSKGLVANKAIDELREEVERFASSFEMPGFDVSKLKLTQ